jgi:hypothetical protein
MKCALTVLFLSGVLRLAACQDPVAPKPAEKPPQDPKALAMLEKLDSLLYRPRDAGLKDLEFTAKLPGGFNLLVRWKDPERVRADLVVPPDAPANVKKQLELVKPRFEADARKHAQPFVTMQLGEVLRDKHKDDEVVLAGANQVKIVARSDASKASFKEQTLTFNEQGLVTQAKVVAPTGLESTIDPKFTESNGKHVYQSMKTTIGTETSTVTFEYVNAGAFVLVKKVTTTAAKGGASQALEFDGFKTNAGIEDGVFEAK